MRDKRIKLIYFSLKGSGIRYIELSWKRLFLYSFIFLFAISVVAIFIIGTFSNYQNDLKLKSLEKFNTSLKKQLEDMKTKVAIVQSEMEKLEDVDDEVRTINELEKIDKDTRGVGVGGTAYNYSDELANIPSATRFDISNTRTVIDQLERRIQLLVESKGEIDARVHANKQTLKHTPSIRPVQGGRITGDFGMRLDPFIDLIKPHYGIDIAAEKGTPVFASAAGVVCDLKNDYRRNSGYGNEVLIDHGNGLQTRYAHLSTILVKLGQKVDRWDKIGTVGKTGRATGPHLHYEVLVDTKPVDPVRYILE